MTAAIRTRKWQDKDGQERYTTEIEASAMQMLGRKGESALSTGGSSGAPSSRAPDKKHPSFDDMDDDIPFATAAWDADPMAQRLARRIGRKGVCHVR